MHRIFAEKCKAEWNLLFKKRKDTEEKSKPTKKKGFFASKESKECPHYKKMPGLIFSFPLENRRNNIILMIFVSYFWFRYWICCRCVSIW